MIWFLIFSSNSLLNRSFIERNNNFSKEWEYSGAAGFENSKLNLLHNHSSDFGAVWCTHRLQESNYSIDFSFQMPSESKSPFSFAIWITKNFGPKGPIFGGPLSFKGMAILFQINQNKLSIEVQENENDQIFDKFSPTLDINFKSAHLDLFFNNDKNSKLDITLKIDGKNHSIYSKSEHVKLNKHWLGVTCLNTSEHSSFLYLESIKIADNEADNAFIESFPYHQKEKSLNLIKDITSKIENESYKPNSSEIVKLVDQLGKTVDFISDEIDLDSIVRKTMIPFSQNWQKRSIKITKQIKTFSQKIQEELDAAENQFSAFKNDIDKQISDFYGNLSDIEQDLYFSIVSFEFDYNSKLKDEKENLLSGTHVLSIALFCVVEAFLVLLFLVSSYDPPGKVITFSSKTKSKPKKKKRRKKKFELP